MTVRKLQKGSDAVIGLPLMDASGKRVRVSDFYSFSIKLFTTDENVFAEYSYRHPDVYRGIVADGEGDWIVINASDMADFHEGVLRYRYHLRAVNGHYDDCMFDSVCAGQLNIFLRE